MLRSVSHGKRVEGPRSSCFARSSPKDIAIGFVSIKSQAASISSSLMFGFQYSEYA